MSRPLFLLAIVFLAGCSTIQTLRLPSLGRPSFKQSILQADLTDYEGVIHVHSLYSHDSKGSIQAIVKAARKNGIDFVVLTDHNNLTALQEKKEGFYGDVLLLAGEEVSSQVGHLLALGVEEEVPAGRPAQESVDAIRKQQGLSFIAHPESPRQPWRDWSVRNFTGIELYNLASDLYDENRLAVGFKILFYPPRPFFKSNFDRPSGALARWDQLLKEQKVVGIAGVDAHQKVKIFGMAIDEYHTMFQVVRVHTFLASLAKEPLYQAIGEGNCYVAFPLVSPIKNFYFAGEEGSQITAMGGTSRASSGFQFKIFLPRGGRAVLLRDGERVFEEKARFGKSALISVPENRTGAYRVEVYRGRKLWILSNPIFLK